jgi:hypothetical protein
MQKFSFIFILFSCFFHATSIFANESICHVITDRKIYITNEVVYGIISFENQNIDGKVLRLHFKKLDSEKIINNFGIKFNKYTASFYIPITSEYESGTYKIELWACKTENKRGASLIHLGNSYIDIINNESSDINRNAFFEMSQPNECEYVKDAFKTIFKKSPDNQVIASFSEADSLILVSGNDNFGQEINITTLKPGLTQNIIKTLSEKIFSNFFVVDGKDQRKFLLLGLYSNQATKMFISNSNDTGSSIFLFDNYEGAHKFNLFGLNSNNIRFAELPTSNEKVEKKPVNDVQWNEILKAMSDGKMRTEIHQYFDVNVIKMSPPQPLAKNKLPKPFKSIITTNYKKFADFQTFCKENSLELKFDKKEDKTIAYLIPPPRFSHSLDARWDNPIFIIDGKCVTDAAIAGQIKHEDIKKFNIYLDMKEITPWIYSFGSNGVIEIETSKNNIESPEILVYGLQNNIAYPQNIMISEAGNHNPMLFPTHYWNQATESQKLQNIPQPSHQKGVKYTLFYRQNNKIKYTDIIVEP